MPSPDLVTRLNELDDLERVGGLLGWDQETMMPAAGVGARGEQMATIGRLHHQRLTDPALGTLLDAEPDGDLMARAVRRDHDRARRIPDDLIADIARAGAAARDPWLAAREAKDLGPFADALRRNLGLRRRLADCFPEADHPYDALLDAYEPGLTTARLREVFAQLTDGLVPLIAAVASSDTPVPSLPGGLDVAAQQRFGLEVVRAWGYEPEGWRFDLAVHPFCSTIAPGDIRVTGRFDRDEFGQTLALFHEVGHGLYEQGVDAALARTTLGTGVSLGVHESQSRLWENWVARSLPFWEHWHPRLADHLPAFADVPPRDVYRALNRVRPSLIRVEADEATYALHVILRFELEVALVEGSLDVDDLPAAWNARFEELLGIPVPDDLNGVLQDIHWSFGEFGYFPTYSIGTIVAAQLWDAAARDLGPQLDPASPGPLREWLRDKVHRHGKLLLPDELLLDATGSALDPGPLLTYLRAKYGALYDLS